MNVVQHLPAVNSIEADLLRFSLVRIAAGSEHPQRSSRLLDGIGVANCRGRPASHHQPRGEG